MQAVVFQEFFLKEYNVLALIYNREIENNRTKTEFTYGIIWNEGYETLDGYVHINRLFEIYETCIHKTFEIVEHLEPEEK